MRPLGEVLLRVRDGACVEEVRLVSAVAREETSAVEDGWIGSQRGFVDVSSRGTFYVRGETRAGDRIEVTGAVRREVLAFANGGDEVVFEVEVSRFRIASAAQRERRKKTKEQERRTAVCYSCGQTVFETLDADRPTWIAVSHFARCGLLCGASPLEETENVPPAACHFFDGCKLCGGDGS